MGARRVERRRPSAHRTRPSSGRSRLPLAGEVFDEIVISPLRGPASLPHRRWPTVAPTRSSRTGSKRSASRTGTEPLPSLPARPTRRSGRGRRRLVGRAWSVASHHAISSSACAPVQPTSSPIVGSTAATRRCPCGTWTSPERRIAVFAHAGTNGVILCHLLGLDPGAVGVGSLRHRSRFDHTLSDDEDGRRPHVQPHEAVRRRASRPRRPHRLDAAAHRHAQRMRLMPLMNALCK